MDHVLEVVESPSPAIVVNQLTTKVEVINSIGEQGVPGIPGANEISGHPVRTAYVRAGDFLRYGDDGAWAAEPASSFAEEIVDGITISGGTF